MCLKNIFIFLFLISLFGFYEELEVIHNDANVFLSTTAKGVEETSLRTYGTGVDVSEEDISFQIEKQNAKNNLKTKPSILKVYLNNVTLNRGELALLTCPNENSLKFNNPNDLKLNKIFFSNKNIQGYASIGTKTVIWTQELNFPKIISNNDELFIKNGRYRLIPDDESSIQQPLNSQNDEYAIKERPRYNLQICPLDILDTGWYSCYIVKRSINDQNIKYYTYLNIVDDYSDDAVSYDVLNEEEMDENEYENRYENYCRNKIKTKDGENKEKGNESAEETDKEENTEVVDHTEPISNDIDLEVSTDQISDQNTISSYNQETKATENKIIDEEEESEEVDSVDQDAIKPDGELNDDLKNTTLKRQIDLLTESTNKDYQLDEIEKDEELEVDETTTQLVHTTKRPMFNLEKPFGTSDEPFSSSENEKRLKNKLVKVKLTVTPKFMNISQYKSFQLDCVYHGPQYLNIKLSWIKNGVHLDGQNNKRIIILDYKQNNSRISILKFSYGLDKDEGTYKCLATNSSRKNILHDSARLVIHSTSSTIVDDYLKFTSYLEDYDNKANNKFNAHSYINNLMLIYLNLVCINKYFLNIFI